MVLNVIAIVLIVAGLFFFIVGVLGILRLPDFYSRQHAAGKCDSLASVLIFMGIAVYVLNDFNLANVLVALKIMLIAAFVFIASPTATHALTESALIIGVKPWSKEGRKDS